MDVVQMQCPKSTEHRHGILVIFAKNYNFSQTHSDFRLPRLMQAHVKLMRSINHKHPKFIIISDQLNSRELEMVGTKLNYLSLYFSPLETPLSLQKMFH